jgi:PAS domain S-box-containing protein
LLRGCALITGVDRHQSINDIVHRVAHSKLMEDYQQQVGLQNELTLMVDALPALVWTALPVGQIYFVNKRWYEYTGIRLGEGCGGGWQAAIHPEDLPEFLERWRSILISQQPGEIQTRFRRSDGEYRWFLIRAAPVHDEQGNILRWYGINIDIDLWVVERGLSQTLLTPALYELNRSERRLRAVINTIPIIAWYSLPDGSGKWWNRRWHDYTGLSPESARELGWQKAIHPDDLRKVMEAWQRLLSAGQAGEIEARLRRFDGEYRWFLLRCEPLRNETGNIVNWYGTNSDIDDAKRAETLLAAEKQLLEMVVSGRPLPLVLDVLCRLIDEIVEGCFSSVLVLDGTRTKIEYAAAPGLLSSDQVLNGHKVTCEEGPCGMAVILNEQVIVSDVASDPRWNAGSYPALALSLGVKSCWSSPIRSLTGELLGTFAITRREAGSPTPFHQALIERFTHIASIAVERTRSEEALRRSEAFLAKAQGLSATGSFSWRVPTDELMWSEELYRIFQFEQGIPITPELIRTRIHPEDRPLFDETVDSVRAAASGFEYEHRLELPNDSIKYVHVVAHATRDQDGRLEYIGAVQDVTERRRAEEALDRLRSELAHVARVMSLGTLTASIAHEVSQPLSGVLSNANTCLRMLNADPPEIDGAREITRRTLRDANRASNVITRLRALFGKKSTLIESVDLNEATREVIALSRNELQRSRVILRAELADDLPPIQGDRVQLQQVILNLLLNASEAMSDVYDRPRQLVVRTEREEGDRVRLTVQDVGVGFKCEDMDRLFEAFYTTKSGGMGIGLSVSRSIIESHHGRLRAAPNDGPGATFSFSIPCVREGVMGSRDVNAVRTLNETNPEQSTRKA